MPAGLLGLLVVGPAAGEGGEGALGQRHVLGLEPGDSQVHGDGGVIRHQAGQRHGGRQDGRYVVGSDRHIEHAQQHLTPARAPTAWTKSSAAASRCARIDGLYLVGRLAVTREHLGRQIQHPISVPAGVASPYW